MQKPYRIFILFAQVSFWLAVLYGRNAVGADLHSVFTVQAPQGKWLVRALTHSATCPSIAWDQRKSIPMQVRAPQAIVPVRSDSMQANSKPAVFDITSCEAEWPNGVNSAKVEDRTVPAPPKSINRILIIADTGCRLKASENAFQDCNDAEKWPFQKIAQSASNLNADLIVHIGDIHYRESPCPEGRVGCAGATWGYGWDAWRDDFFNPAQSLLASSPWIFVRGNHESCFRAGQGWFRFFDALPWTAERNCNEPANDMQGDFSEPFAVSLSSYTQFIIFDSSKSSSKGYQVQDPVFLKYQEQLKLANQLASTKRNSFFINHHPLLAAAAVADPSKFKAGGSGGLQSVFRASEPNRLFPTGVTVAMHGHIHLFEVIGFKTDLPVSLVLGNSGSMNEGFAPTAIQPTDRVYNDSVVDTYVARSDYGFATFDRVEEASSESWLLTEYSTEGEAVIRCKITDRKSRCN